MPAATRPRKLKTLLSDTHAMFGKELEMPDVAELIQQLKTRGRVVVGTADNVSYRFDD